MSVPTTAAQQGLGAALRKLHRTYIRRLQAQLAEHGLSVAQYLHLRALWEEAGLTQNEVSARLGIEKASSTAVLEALERDGLINRVRDARDRRNVRVYLSDAGENLRGTVMPFAQQVATQASHGLTEADLDAFFRTIDWMLSNLLAVEKDAEKGRLGPGTRSY
ncbi:MarR family transcriptional regulator [Roseomonas sp. KE2513]|uniref:MarR family winged helix-turn-helix transcriptional regulator n=1 Tax=Roseomonas sp. KE2513 TaxID=2479202 RepID=UPI0018DF5C31|nr:MarR family winged helix-turn-helix transcriptional regulator [Roseomonas sp. KE2513]MBI0539184.1 MarR family transcriptional regulator [Roseomonas sp. KE2513]